jgi:D-aminoacyl-tRNA deacylase
MKNYAIIISKKDPAGINIFNQLINNYDFIVDDNLLNEINKKFINLNQKSFIEIIYQLNNLILVLTNIDLLECDNLDNLINADVFIFASKHKALSENSCFCVHTPGNFSIAKFGGKDFLLTNCAVDELNYAFFILKKENNLENFIVTFETTHHGPIINKPAMFIEIGSTINQWNNINAAKIISKTIIKITSFNYNNLDKKIILGIGGPHYCNNFNEIAFNEKYLIGHICPKYHLIDLNEEMLKQAIIKSANSGSYEESLKRIEIVLDWKGLGNNKEKIINLLSNLELMYKKTTNIKKNNNILKD